MDTEYRYWLERHLIDVDSAETLLFVMLNPSTADDKADDNTIRKCIKFTRAFGYGVLAVVNLYAARSTDPKKLFLFDDPVGQGNDDMLRDAIRASNKVVCAWGRHAKADRADWFKRMAQNQGVELSCLHINKDGSPKHPLYIKDNAPLLRYD